MVEEETEIFEINDFTTASEWERFVARIEEVLHEWKLSTSSQQHGERLHSTSSKQQHSPAKSSTTPEPPPWEETVASLQFADYNFTMTRHRTSGTSSASEARKDSNSETFSLEKTQKRDDVGDVVDNDDDDDDDEDARPEAWLDMMDKANIFPSRAHCLHRWYGLKDFVVVTTLHSNEEINNQSRANMLLSSLSLAALNTGCQVPLFVQVGPKWRRLFLGTLECPGFRTTFEMAQFKKSSDKYNNMSDFSDLFKEKLGIRKGTIAHPAQVSVRFTYVINDWSGYPWTQLPPDLDNPTIDIGVVGFGDLPFGSCEDPIDEFFLYATWPVLSESVVTDYGTISALDPLFANEWSVRARMTDRTETLLGDYLKRFLNLCSSTQTASSSSSSFSTLKGKSTGEGVNASLALQRLTEPRVPSLGKVVRKATSKLTLKPEESPIPVESLNAILHFLFPDAKLDSSQHSHASDPSTNSCTTTTTTVEDEVDDKFSLSYKELSRCLKSAPPSSLTSQLATCMCIVNKCHGGLRAVTHLWEEFVLEMRYRWENNYAIPGLEAGAPNMGCSLLHQKLQMLNCCIERKKARDASSPISVTPTNSNKNNLEISSEEEEFYECMEVSESADSEEGADQSGASSEPEGRLKPLEGNIGLLEFPDRLIYIPVTQEPAPMTEDMLEEHAEVLSRLGTSAEGAHLRARMQSACLLSDMEAFKAANPGCTLGDFVRWYSPRDWVEEATVDEEGKTTRKGHLSQRMEVPDNMWVEVWRSARSVPSWRQRRLFDDTKEAEKVLHWLASMKPSDVGLRLMPMLVQSAVTTLLKHSECQLPFLRRHLSQITIKLSRATRCGPSEELKNFEDLVHHLTFIEQTMAKAQSLLEKLRHVDPSHTVNDLDLQRFVSDLMEFPEVSISASGVELPSKAHLGALVHRFFLNAYKTQLTSERAEVTKETNPSTEANQDKADKLPKPMGKEYIFRLSCRRPAPWSRTCPQRFYCVVTPDEFRLAGAFTSDTTFL